METASLDLSTIDGVITDMDGVLWHGERALPGMTTLFSFLRDLRVPLVLSTNNSSRTPAEYRTKLDLLGVRSAAESNIVTSGTVMVDYLSRSLEIGAPVYVIGSPALAFMITEAGFRVSKTAAVVVVGIDTQLTYEKLREAAQLINGGAAFLGTNPDAVVPTEDGLSPGTGSILAALQSATGRAPLVMGKPAGAMYDLALRVLRTRPERTLMIGDRLDTDILGARQAGIRTALALTGVASREDVSTSDIRPDAVFRGLPELIAAWRDS